MLQPLTTKQSLVLDYIAKHIVQRQRPPTRKDIAVYFEWASANAAEEVMQALERKGYVALDGSTTGSQWQRYPRVICWPNSVLPVLQLAAA